jgi:hypothetical protein
MPCSACHRARPLDELLAFWPVGDPDRRRHVCRPSLSLPGPDGARGGCFSAVVGLASKQAIALAAPAAPPELVRPVRPDTAGWFRLLSEAGVRAAA